MPAWHTLARAPPTSPDINKDGTIKSFSDAGAALWRRRVPSLLYHEPDVVSLLVLSSFLYLLNVARVVFDSLIGAGLIGEIALGIVYEQAGILPEAWREFLLVLGYLGLVLIVFEGGLDVDASFLRAVPLGIAAALVGVLVPIALTFAAFNGFGFSNLYAFTAGSALASTSLGTTFFVLQAQSREVQRTQIARILTAAALFDDIVALVLLSVVTALGERSSTSLVWVIGRPILASALVALLTPVIAMFIIRPMYARFLRARVERAGPLAMLFLGVCVLSAMLAITSYAGTTNLLGAFLAGYVLKCISDDAAAPSDVCTFQSTFKQYVGPLQHYLFAPLFFSSIGFTLPFPNLFTGTRIWRGIVYSLLMTVGKMLAGVVVICHDLVSPRASPAETKNSHALSTMTPDERSLAHPSPVQGVPDKFATQRRSSIDWCAAAFLGTALVPRGEIGVLILQVAYASPGDVLSEEAYLVALWSVALCTIFGPVLLQVLLKKFASRILESPKWGEQTDD